jgi:hypothetical protein
MVLINHDPIKPSLGAVLELFEVHAVEFMGLFGAEMRIGKHQVVITQPPGFFLRISRVPHFGEEVDFLNHVGPPIRDDLPPPYERL